MVRERILSDDEIASLRRLWATAPTIDDAAKRLGVCRETARTWAKRLHLVRPDPANAWSPDKVEKLIELVKAGHSGGVIAAQIGMTRNSVIGKVNRLGMRLGNSRNGLSQNLAAQLRKPHQTPLKKKKQFQSIRKPQFEKAIIPPPAVDDVARVKFADLESHHCRFGVGDPKHSGFGFCGLDRAPGSSYCAVHTARCWVAVPVRKNQVPFREKVGA